MRNILVYRTGSIGDTVVALPAYWAIKSAFPDAKLTLLSNGKNDSILIAKKVLPKGLFDAYIAYPNIFKTFTQLFLKIRLGKFDTLVYLLNRNREKYRIKRDLAFFRLAGIKKVIGANYLLENGLSENALKPLPQVESEQNYLINCLKFDDINVVNKQVNNYLHLTLDEIENANNWLKQNCDSALKSNILVAVMPESNWKSRIWAEENYIQVIKNLIDKEDIFPIVFGGKNDSEKANRMLSLWKKGANACGELGIRGDAALLGKCRMYLGNDTGTMHLAAAMNIPCVTIFAATDYPNRWFPEGKQHISLREAVECEGCFTANCFNNHLCLQQITVDKVYQSCLKILNDNQ